MSPNVGNFVHDLVEMAKAMETLPGVQAELASAQAALERNAETIQRLEMKLMERSSEIEKLHSDVRSAEVARDDAELRFLEADDHIAAFRRLVSTFSTDTASLLKAIDPPKPETVVEAKPEPVYPEWAIPPQPSVASPSPQGPSETNPTPLPSAEPSPIPTAAPSTPVTPEAAGSTGGAGEGVEPTPTSAPAQAIGIGTEPAQSSSEEPTRFEWVNGIKHTRDAWYAWYDEQPYEFKQNFDWNTV